MSAATVDEDNDASMVEGAKKVECRRGCQPRKGVEANVGGGVIRGRFRGVCGKRVRVEGWG